MSKLSWLAVAAAAVLASACVHREPSGATQLESARTARTAETEQRQTTQSEAAPQAAPQTAQPATPQTAQTSGYTDAQVSGFVAARDAIQQLTPGQTTEQQAANQQRIAQVLAQNSLTGEQYNAIAAASRTDQALANRIAAASVSGTSFTDAQLQAFVRASTEIEPINQSLATATPEQRTQASQQIRAILTRNSLDAQTYNGIAARAQSDPQLAQRIASLRTTPPAEGPG
jgi:hypothetical protein